MPLFAACLAPADRVERLADSAEASRISAFIDILQTPRAVTGRPRIARGLDSR